MSMADAFDTLGLPATFDLAGDRIERAYLARAAIAHPDADGDDDQMAIFNDAYREL